MKIILFIGGYILGAFNYASSQDNVCSYEQIAINYFFDSLVSKEYGNIKTVYYKPQVNPRSSKYNGPVEFKDYLEKNDSITLSNIIKIQKKIDQLQLDECILNVAKSESNAFKIIPYQKTQKKKSIVVETCKRNLYKIGFYFIEVVVYRPESRSNFFVEIDEQTKMVTRWSVYEVDY